MKRVFNIFFALAILFSSCNDDESPIIEEGSIQFTVSSLGSSSGRIEEDEIPASVVISVEDLSGNEIISSGSYTISPFQNVYLVDPILLEIGEYYLTEFLVLNEEEEVIYATPKDGALLESLVDQPLPIEFSIAPDEVTELDLEVVSTAGIDPEDLGYSSISFEIVPTTFMLVSVFEEDGSAENLAFVNADLTVSADGDSLFTVGLGDSINVVKLRSDYDSYSFKVQVEGYADKIIESSIVEVLGYRTVPLKVVFGSSLNQGLIAHYSFTGNTDDNGPNGLDGVLGNGSGGNEPNLTSDRNNATDRAYNFDGSQYIDLSENDIFDLGDYPEFSISTWVNPSDTTNGIILSKYIAASDNRMYLLRIFEGNIRFSVHDNGASNPSDMLETPVLTGWHHIAVVLDDGEFTLFVNGTEKVSTPKTVTILADSPTAKTVIGAVHQSNVLFDRKYTGDIDEVRMYDRALTVSEVAELAAQ